MKHLDGIQDYQIKTDDQEYSLYENKTKTEEASNVENKEHKNTNTRPIIENPGKGIISPKIKQ